MPETKRVPLKNDGKTEQQTRRHPEDQEIDETLAPASITRHELRTIPFFELLLKLSPGDWDTYMAYLYRSKGSGIIKTNDKDDHYIQKISHAFDEEYVKQSFGGGGYTVILNHSPSRKAVRKHTFNVDGPPILQPGELDTRGKASNSAGGKSDTALMVEQMEKMFQKVVELVKNDNGAEKDAMTRVIATMQKGTEAVIDVQKSAFEKQLTASIGSSTGHPLVDKFLEAAITKMGTQGTEQPSPVKQMAEMFTVFKQITGGSTGGGGLLGNLGEIKSVLEILKDMGIKIGGEGGGEGDWKAVLAAQAPGAIQMILGALDEWRKSSDQTRLQLAHLQARIAGAPQQQLPQPQPPPQPASASPQPQAQAPASALPTNFASGPQPQEPAERQPSTENVVEFPQQPQQQSAPVQEIELEVNFDLVATIISRCFDKGDPGDAAALIIKRLYQGQLESYMPYLTDLAKLNGLVGLSPILQEAIKDDDWPVFMSEFVREMKRNDDEEPEPGPEAPAPGA
ncbi:MAG TPA: hypothetical protein VHA33_29280 [Candidatus Angelobacter sp.]|jgi:hypothetical protein|nr:hypothetical protein [Candidatus Angelobacter sp.]